MTLPARIVELMASREDYDEITTTITEEAYDIFARNGLPAILLRRCGLEVVPGVDLQRSMLGGQEWDFRAPVTVAVTEPSPTSELGVFEVFPSKPSYVRPPRIPDRLVTPSKFGEPPVEPAAHYLALFEITTTTKWTAKRPGQEAMLARLEKRLQFTLERAHENRHLRGDESITSLVAAIGVVAPSPYSTSVRDLMVKKPYRLLTEMLNAGHMQYDDQSALERFGEPAFLV